MKVTLIIPPSGFLLDERVFPSLGILKVGAVLREMGVDVQVLDFSGMDMKVISRILIPGVSPISGRPTWWNSDVIGITATMPQMPITARIVRRLFRIYQDADRPHLVLGGPQVTLLNASAKAERKRGVVDGRANFGMVQLSGLFDTLICGDGEHAIRQYVTALRLGADPPRVIDADEPTSTLFLTKADLNTAPFPARDLIDMDSYRYDIEGHKTHSLIGQLGCPFGCTFCGGRRSPFLRRVRTRTTENVVAEVRHLYERHGATGFMFLDDELNVNTQFMDLLGQLADLQSTLGVDFRFRGLLKSQLVTAAMATAMYRTGFRQVLVGFESGDPRMLLNMNKQATQEENTRCVELLTAAGIRVKALMSLGHAGESPASIEATRRWLLAVRPDDFDVTIITVYPGTPYYDDAVLQSPPNDGRQRYTYTDPRNGDRLHMDDVDQIKDTNFYKGVPGEYRAFVWTDHLTADDLVRLRDDVEADVRTTLKIPYPTAAPEQQFEHSMGMR